MSRLLIFGPMFVVGKAPTLALLMGSCVQLHLVCRVVQMS